MKKNIIATISLCVFIASLIGLYFFPHINGRAVKYVMTESGSKFKEFEGKLYDVEEYKEGNFYLAGDDGVVYETNYHEWKKSRMLCILLLVIKLVAIVSLLIFSFLSFFHHLFKRYKTKNNSLLSI